MLGARQGCYMTLCTDWDYLQVRDFEYLNQQFSRYENLEEIAIVEELQDLGDKLRLNLNLPLAELDDKQSLFFKTVWNNPPRYNSMVTELDEQWDQINYDNFSK